MSAHPAPQPLDAHGREPEPGPWHGAGHGAGHGVELGGMSLAALLTTQAERAPARPLVIDQADKAAWSGRPAITWTNAVALSVVRRLGAGLRRFGLPPGSPVGVGLAGTGEAYLALLAVQEAGHLPCLLPVDWDEARLLRAAEAAGLQAVITQGVLGAARPAEAFCRVAARYFGLRFVAAFGPQVPDGVISLDRSVVETDDPPAGDEAPSRGIATFARRAGPGPVPRSDDALVAAAAAHLVAARVGAGERVLTLLPPSDLAGLATGFVAALLAGAALEAHAVFDGPLFAAALARAVPTHLVAPAWMEEALAGSVLPPTLRSVTLVHRAPCRLTGRGRLRGDVVDALALDETALLSGRREGGDLGALLARAEASVAAGLVEVARDPADGRLRVRGPAVAAQSSRGAAEPPGAWRASPFRVETFAGVATAVENVVVA